ncbi:COX15/CtaA family protein [Micrococcus sp.]|uniref:COX15/CtaA family protein n=1 Tax=Micrococcus sp. TaxID=1271 RepID=UPI002A913CB3|nr:COX15/CtaA family protein [Micrococcus sp.]MDY6054474.1 COX15/CtaA family protein [Micrococcus sp.]
MSAPSPAEPRTADAAPESAGLHLPERMGPFAHLLAWLNLLANMTIVVTGGVVRVTGSGLGCPTWPTCTPESLTTTPEMGWHGLIEFGNRTLTGVLAAFALLMVLAVVRMRRTHGEVVALAWAVLGGVLFQAVLGGITVRMGLNPWIVAAHYIASAVMIVLAAMLLLRVRTELQHGPGARVADGATTPASRAAAWTVFLAGAVVVVLGTVVTGTGPHSGDPDAARHAFDALVITRAHALPAYLVLGAAIVLLVLTRRQPGASAAQRSSAVFLVAAVVAQAAVGYWQHFTGLPVGVVILHLLGSTLVILASTLAWQRQTSRYTVPATA